MNHHGAVVFFDGLDEVPAAQRKRVKQALTIFAAIHDKCWVIVTCRTHSYRTDRNWQLEWTAVHELAPFYSLPFLIFSERSSLIASTNCA